MAARPNFKTICIRLYRVLHRGAHIMKKHLLLTTVSVLAIPFVVLTGAAPAMAEDEACSGMNFFQCQVSRAVYAVEHVGQSDKPAAKLTTAPASTDTAPAA